MEQPLPLSALPGKPYGIQANEKECIVERGICALEKLSKNNKMLMTTLNIMRELKSSFTLKEIKVKTPFAEVSFAHTK